MEFQILTRKIKMHVPFLVVALVQFAITFATDRGVFASPSTKEQWLMYMGTKFFVLIFLVVFWQGVSFLFRQCRAKNPQVRAFLKYFFIYFGVMFAFQLILWPGVWRFDDVHILEFAMRLECEFWQHWLTSAFYIFSMQLLPLPGGIVIIQIFFISFMVAYIMMKTYNIARSKWVYLFFIVLFLPPVITNNLYPLRLVLCAYIEFFFFALVFFKVYENSKITYFDCLGAAILVALMAAWRAEGIIYFFLVPVILVLLLRKKFSWKQGLIFLAVLITLFSAINQIQKTPAAGRNSSQVQNLYTLTAYLEIARSVVNAEVRFGGNADDIEVIDAVLPVDYLLSGVGEYAYQNRREYTQEDLDKFKKTIMKMVLRHPWSFLKNATEVFWQTNTRNMVVLPTSLLDVVTLETSNEYSVNKFKNFHSFRLNRPINKQLRIVMANLLEGRYPNDVGADLPVTKYVYNAMPALLILFLLMIIWIIKRNKLFLIPLVILVKTFFIVATAPQRYFMYYFPAYILGYCFGAMCLIIYISQRKKEITCEGIQSLI